MMIVWILRPSTTLLTGTRGQLCASHSRSRLRSCTEVIGAAKEKCKQNDLLERCTMALPVLSSPEISFALTGEELDKSCFNLIPARFNHLSRAAPSLWTSNEFFRVTSIDHAVNHDPDLVPAFDANPGSVSDSDLDLHLDSGSVQNIPNDTDQISTAQNRITQFDTNTSWLKITCDINGHIINRPIRAGHTQGLTDHKSSNAMSSHRPKRNRNPPACHRTAQSPYQLNWVWNTTYG
ncbi:hypothetical protein EVAR_84360_1 [Eumeta japonica]|uniref:Uncharacterized protein n=1 Tax=Eumeta variegata TaxID=151549 RepID=A0A4C1U4B6_EUMVA|nr:hypothetical protein EVAR_84360_1 [Eumeta japonica]